MFAVVCRSQETVNGLNFAQSPYRLWILNSFVSKNSIVESYGRSSRIDDRFEFVGLAKPIQEKLRASVRAGRRKVETGRDKIAPVVEASSRGQVGQTVPISIDQRHQRAVN